MFSSFHCRIQRSDGSSVIGRRFVAMLLTIGFLILNLEPSHASEYGVSTYHSGLADSMVAYIRDTPGTTWTKSFFLFADASASVTTEDESVRDDVRLHAYGVAFQLGYTTGFSLFDSNWTVAAFVPFALVAESSRLSIIGTPFSKKQDSSAGGMGDPILTPCILHWDHGQFHWLTALSVYVPIGNYDAERAANVGLNRWAFEPDFGLTWLNESGQEVSVLTGYTINVKNMSTHYQSGQEFHADFAAMQHLRSGLEFGMAGYALQQTTRDEGSGAILGEFKSRVLAIGPMAGLTFHIMGAPAIATFKYDFEFFDQNRISGNTLWLTIAAAFGATPDPR